MYGTTLISTQLNASADVAGDFGYPAAGAVLYADQTLSTIYTPTDTTNYNMAMVSVRIEVI